MASKVDWRSTQAAINETSTSIKREGLSTKDMKY